MKLPFWMNAIGVIFLVIAHMAGMPPLFFFIFAAVLLVANMYQHKTRKSEDKANESSNGSDAAEKPPK